MSTATQAMEQLAKTAKDIRLSLDEIYVNTENNVREDYDADELAELKANIESVGGILTPLQVVELEPTEATENKQYALVAGFRRSLCLQDLAEEDPSFAEDIPVRVLEPQSEGGMKIAQLIENMQRSDLKPLEKAQGMREAMENDQFSQKELARLLGVSAQAVSQHLKLLELPDAIQDLLDSGEISYSHARVIMYSVPQDQWLDAAKLAKSLTFGEFEKRMNSRYGAKDDEGGEGEAAEGDASPQRSTKVLRASKITNTYVPFFKTQAKEAKTPEEKTAWETRLDTVKWFLQEDDTKLAELCKPYEEELEKKEAAEKASKEADSKEKAYVKSCLSELRKLVKAMPEPGEKKNTLAEDLAIIRKKVEDAVSSDEKKAELGFKLEDVDKFMEGLGEAWQEDEKKRADAAAARKKKKEEEEAKKKEAESKEAATPGDGANS